MKYVFIGSCKHYVSNLANFISQNTHKVQQMYQICEVLWKTGPDSWSNCMRFVIIIVCYQICL